MVADSSKSLRAGAWSIITRVRTQSGCLTPVECALTVNIALPPQAPPSLDLVQLPVYLKVIPSNQVFEHVSATMNSAISWVKLTDELMYSIGSEKE